MISASNLFDISGRTVVVTGGYGQIGRVVSLSLLDAGANVVVLEPHPDEAITVTKFGEAADKIVVLKADVTNRASLEAAREEVQKLFGSPYGLINNAALDSPPDSSAAETGPFEDYPVSSWDKVMDVNAKGVFQCCQVFGKPMAQAGRGSIVNVASIYGSVSPDQGLYQYRRERGETFYKPVAYSASKSALYNLTRYIAAYWGPNGVRSNTVTFAGVYNNQDPQFLANYERKIPLRRAGREHLHGMAEASDYSGPMVFLMSDASSYMTGADLRVDGGFLAL